MKDYYPTETIHCKNCKLVQFGNCCCYAGFCLKNDKSFHMQECKDYRDLDKCICIEIARRKTVESYCHEMLREFEKREEKFCVACHIIHLIHKNCKHKELIYKGECMGCGKNYNE